ncbi:tautomerase family protein [Humibacter ginsenosidimutans]|uniref:Tautomerase family protein n=1 Tax=Humibacter ginsenosidimutans TaxID=2599293 RepID=A0A5B8M5X2_9MICO|nr:tautomerase family protein [Humibacter ginsenosidimutans]QDZ14870.1 tautomerase family protein [Humibacter ginsenosidimutans]
MPLVRIDSTDAPLDLLERLGQAVHDALVEAIGIPTDDHFQVLSSGASRVIADPGYVGVSRDEHAVIVQVVLRSGRTVEQKKAFYAAVAAKASAAGVEPRNVTIVLIENELEDWSFGEGIAQYLR